MLGAALGMILPWQTVPAAMTFLLLAGTGFAVRMLARELLSGAASTFAGCCAIFFGYALYTAYERTAYGELAGGIWIPLLLLYLLRPQKPGAVPWSLFPIPFLIAAAWLSNAPVGVVACYAAAAIALGAAFLQRSWAPIGRAALGTALGLGLVAFFLLPAAFEQRWVDIAQATSSVGLQIEDNWLFRRHADPAWWWHDHELQYASLIVVAMVAVAILGAILARRRGVLPDAARSFWLPLALIAPVALLLQFPFTTPVWNLLPKLRFLQFPWRWMVVLEGPMALFFAGALWSLKPKLRTTAVAASGVLCLLAVAAAGHSLYLRCDAAHSVAGVLETYTSSKGFSGTAEYSPPGATTTVVPQGLSAGCLIADPATDLNTHACEQTFGGSTLGNAEQFTLSASTTKPGYLILRLRSYAAWQVTVNGKPVELAPIRPDGLIAVPVAAGDNAIEARWRTTPDVVAGRAISAIALFALAALAFAARRKNAVRLSS